MNFTFRNKKIAGILAILPAHEVKFEEELSNYQFTPENSLKLKKVMGYDRHRLIRPDVTVSDLAVFGLNYLFDQKMLGRDEFEALILVTQSPDHFIPPTSNIIQGRLGLKPDLFCLDINQGCAAYLIGLIQAFLLLELETIQRVILVNGDILSRKVSPKDRNSYPLVGDAASITIIEKETGGTPVFVNLKMDGSRGDALMIPAGGFRMPSTPETAVSTDIGDGNYRSKDHLTMKGSDIFNFVQVEVPPMIASLLEFGGVTSEAVDYYLFHQPNKFMLEKLASKMKVSIEKMPNNVVTHFGNSSGVTIPVNICHNIGEKLLNNTYQLCLAGFGSGLTWSSMLLKVGGLHFCQIIEYPG